MSNQKKFVIVVTWHPQDGKPERKAAYSTITALLALHPGIGNLHTVKGWIVRRRQPYICPLCTVERLPIERKE